MGRGSIHAELERFFLPPARVGRAAVARTESGQCRPSPNPDGTCARGGQDPDADRPPARRPGIASGHRRAPERPDRPGVLDCGGVGSGQRELPTLSHAGRFRRAVQRHGIGLCGRVRLRLDQRVSNHPHPRQPDAGGGDRPGGGCGARLSSPAQSISASDGGPDLFRAGRGPDRGRRAGGGGHPGPERLCPASSAFCEKRCAQSDAPERHGARWMGLLFRR